MQVPFVFHISWVGVGVFSLLKSVDGGYNKYSTGS